MSDAEESVCSICCGTPREWEEFGETLMQNTAMMHFHEKHGDMDIVVDESGHRVTNTQMRKAMYRMFTEYIQFGHLGRGVRIPVPEFVAPKIRGLYPAVDGEYMGFTENVCGELE